MISKFRGLNTLKSMSNSVKEEILKYYNYDIEIAEEIEEELLITLIQIKNRLLDNREIDTSKTDKNKENDIIEPLNAFKLMEAPYMSKLLKEERYDEFMKHLKQSEVEIANKIIELIRASNKK